MRISRSHACSFIALAGAAFCLSALPARAAKTKKADPYRDFVSSCMDAFNQSAGSDSEGAGKQICQCTSKESRHQGVTVAALKRETAKIKKNPAYQIQDENLLNSFRYCTIEAMRAVDKGQPHDEGITPVR